MKKLSLDLDDLRVESFDTAEADAQPRGTVHAAQAYCCYCCCCCCCCTCGGSCGGTCQGQQTCPGVYSCNYYTECTCAASCNYTDCSCNYSCNYSDCSCAYSCNYSDCDCSYDYNCTSGQQIICGPVEKQPY